MQWIKASEHYPEGWQLGRVDGKKLPLLFAPHVITDLTGKTYKRELVEYFTDEPAPSPDLETEARQYARYNYAKAWKQSEQSAEYVQDVSYYSYLAAARRYASTVEQLNKDNERLRGLFDDLISHAMSTQWISSKPGKSLEENIQELKDNYHEVSDIGDRAEGKNFSLIEQVHSLKQENERLRGVVEKALLMIQPDTPQQIREIRRFLKEAINHQYKDE